VRLRRFLLRLLGQALLVIGFVLAFSAVIGLGNGVGPVEAILKVLGAAGLVVLGWMVWGRSTAPLRRSPHA
jgi:hypothetical protein